MKTIFIFFVCTLINSTLCTNSTLKYQRKANLGPPTHFLFTAYAECPFFKHWCVQLSYYEHDWTTPNDQIVTTAWFCTQDRLQVIQTRGSDDGDGPFDDWYELYVEVRHNCRNDGNFVYFDHKLPEISTKVSSAPINYKLTL